MSSNQWLEVTIYDPYGNNPSIELNCQMGNTIKDVKEKLHQQQLQRGNRIIKLEDMVISDLDRNQKKVQYDDKKLSDLFNQSLVSSQELLSVYYEHQSNKVQQLQKEQKQQFEKPNSPILRLSCQTQLSTQIAESLIQQCQEEIQDYERIQNQQQQIFPYNQYCKSCQQRIFNQLTPTHPQSQQNLKTQNDKDNFQNK